MDENWKQHSLKQTGELSAYLIEKQEAKRVRFEARQVCRLKQRAYVQMRVRQQEQTQVAPETGTQ
jgi:hypothetical protein